MHADSHYSKGSDGTFKFLCWNVNGLKNKIRDSDFINYLLDFQIICLVETFVDQIPNTDWLPNYDIFYSPAVKEVQKCIDTI